MNNKEGNLFVKNIDPSKTPKEFNAFFTETGPSCNTLLKTDHNGDSLGYGYVQYMTKEIADTIIAELNGQMFGDCAIVIESLKHMS